jgi:hypothetical protein
MTATPAVAAASRAADIASGRGAGGRGDDVTDSGRLGRRY